MTRINVVDPSELADQLPVLVTSRDDDWTPTPAAIEINRARIAERIAARPGFYRFTNAGSTP